MEAEEAVQEEPEQTQNAEAAEDGGEALSDVVEGFEEAPAEEPGEEPEGEEPAEEEQAAREGEKKSSVQELQQQNQELQKQINQLGYALRKAQQQQKRETQDQKQDDEELTDDQLRQLMREHKDDPDTLFNIMQYASQRAAKKANKETVDSQRVSAIKQQAQNFLSQRYPDVLDEGTQAHQLVNNIKNNFMLNDHPAGDYFAVSAYIADNLETLQKQAYEAGKQDGLKGKVESKRKESVTDKSLLSSKKSSSKKTTDGLTGNHAKTASQMGLTPSQKKIYQRLVGKNADDHAEA